MRLLIWISLMVTFLGICAQASQRGQMIVDHQSEGAGKEDPWMDALAEDQYRPAWSPLPTLRGDIQALPALHKLLESSKVVEFRRRSAFLIGQISSKTSIPILLKGLKDSDHQVQMFSGISLAWLGDPRGLPACEAAFSNEQSWIRYYAAYGLWNIHNDKAKEVLLKNQENQQNLVLIVINMASSTAHIQQPQPPKPVAPNVKGAAQLELDSVFVSAANLYSREADWWWHRGNFDEAVRALEVSVMLDPKYEESYGVISWLQWSMGREDEALDALKRGVAASPKDPAGYQELGEFYYRFHKYELALSPYETAVKLGGSDLARSGLAHTYEKLGRPKDALSIWQTLFNSKDFGQVAHRNYDRIKASTGK